MEMNEEYHDPDYPGLPVCVKKELPNLTEDEKIEKIKQIVRREFRRELDAREDEVALIDQRMTQARRYLHQLRYALVVNYYTEQRLQMSSSQIEDEVAAQSQPRARAEVASILRDSQRNVHPSVRKLLGRKTVDMEEIFRSREPRIKTRVDYSAMVQAKNVTISADTTKTLRPVSDEPAPEPEPSSSSAPPRKVPRHLEPKVDNVLTLEGVTRNKQKHRYRIIVGNTSKYMPPASRADRSTHKWLLYVRGPPLLPDVSRVVTAVTVRLHHSYAPHHIVVIDKPPFQVSRRGWGEFPAKLTLEFAMPYCNRPATLEHTIKLDRNYTGLQTLGAETIVDVWLYSTPEMLPFEYKTEQEPTAKPDEQCGLPIKDVKTEPQSDEHEEISEISEKIGEISEQISENKEIETDEWLNFFTNDSTEVNVDEMFVKNVKKEKLPELEVNKGNKMLTHDSQVNQTLKKDAKVSQAIKNDSNTPQIVAMNHKVGQTVATDDVNTTVTKGSKFKQSMENDGRSNVKIEPMDDPITNGDHENNEFVEKPKETNSKRIVKYMDPNTRKIYYLEVDRALDLNKIQEIVIDSQGQMKKAKVSPKKVNLNNGLRFVRKKKGESLLKPEIQDELVKKFDNPNQNQNNQIIISNGYDHIKNDHCYLANDWCVQAESEPKIEMKRDYVNEIRLKITKLTCPRVIVSYLLKHIPVISGDVKDPDFVRSFPFVVGSHEKYWKLDFAKRRNIEWSRAKLIERILAEKFKNDADKVWKTKSILIFSRLHGYYPVRPETTPVRPEQNKSELNDWSSWNDLENSRKSESNIRDLYPNSSNVRSLQVFKPDSYRAVMDDSFEDICDSDEEIDVVSEVKPVRVKGEVMSECRDDLTVLPVNSEDRHKFLFIERMCADIGIELRNEDIGNGYSYSAVHCVLLTAMRCFAEELIRAGLADQLAFGNDPHLPGVWTGSSSRASLRLEHVYRGLVRAPRSRVLRAAGRAAAARVGKL